MKSLTVVISVVFTAAIAGESYASILQSPMQFPQPIASNPLVLVQVAPRNNANTTSTGGGAGNNSQTFGLNWLITRKVQKDVDAIVTECGHYDPVYRIDCLREGFLLAAKSLPNTGEYRKVKQILLNASTKLDRVVRRYQDLTAPAIRPKANANPRFKTARRYRAVRRDKLTEALSEARAIVDEAQTQLLRSSQNSEARLAHYQTIATAVGSAKVLLRSS